MKYRTLGKTGLKVSDVGIGTWQLANDDQMWVGADLQESLKSLSKYVDLGGNFIDTAFVYGYIDDKQKNPTSEDLIGQFLKESGKREDLVIASKIMPKNWGWPALKGTEYSEVFPRDHMEKQLNTSLRRLGVESIDLMQFHVWHDDWADIDEWKEFVEKTKKDGRVKHWGISANDYQPSNCIKALDTGLIETVQFIFNIFHQKPTEKLLPYAKENNIGLITRVPLDEAGLTGKITSDSDFAKGDFRNKYFGGERKEELIKRVGQLQKVLDESDDVDSMVELAVRYTLSFDEVSVTIPGMREVHYVEQNTAFSDKGKLPADVLKRLEAHIWERNFYTGHDPVLKESGFVEA